MLCRRGGSAPLGKGPISRASRAPKTPMGELINMRGLWETPQILSPFCFILLGLLLFLSGFPGSSAGKESTRNTGNLGSTPGLGRSPGEGKGYPLQYSGLENSMDYIVHGVTKSQTQLSDFHFRPSLHSALFFQKGRRPLHTYTDKN